MQVFISYLEQNKLGRNVEKMLNLSLFAERLSELMLEENLTQNALAEKVNIDRSAISRYLSGRKLPTYSILIKLADYFHCTTDFLLALENENTCSEFKECPPFKEQLHFLLEKYKKTKYQIKKEQHIAESAIYNWQNGVFNPSVYDLVKLAEFFDCSVDYILGRGN